MIDFEIDSASPIPLYLQIVERVRRLIALGALRPGDRLPTVRELATRTRINRNTAARAIRYLERERVVRTRPGRGTFVSSDGLPEIAPERRERSLDEALDRLLVEAHGLGVPMEELGWRLSRRIDAFLRRRRESRGREAVPSHERPVPEEDSP
jgi:GntR family transcriptional regulator